VDPLASPVLDLESLLQRLPGLRVAVVGDVMLDRFVFGAVDRISPEAPVPVVHVRDEDDRLGGAANVAANVASLSAAATVFGVVGPGDAGQRIREVLETRGLDCSGLVVCPERTTTVKTRIVAGQQQIVRIDRETQEPLADASRAALLDRLAAGGPFDAVIVSDYGKGVVDRALLDLLRTWHDGGTPVVVDPKQGNFDLYSGTTCITPNQREAAGACHARIDTEDDARAVGWQLRERLQTDLVLLTRGEHGMMLFAADGEVTSLPTVARHVYDVTGAGDTVIASFTTLLAAGAPAPEAARWANVAAGLVVGELGTAVVTPDDLRAAGSR